MKKYLILGICLLLGISNARAQVAQVTIGSNEAPRAGTILDLKSEADGTSYKGLALPRVKLTDKDNLYPMFETTPGSGVANDKYDSPTKKTLEDKKHLGLMVYSVGGCDLDGNGVYTWTENGWEKLANDGKQRSGLSVDATELTFWNGPLGLAQEVVVGWSPHGATYATPNYSFDSRIDFYMTPASGTFVKSPQVVSIKPKDFTEAEIKSDRFRMKEGEIVFTLDNSICNDGNQQSHTIRVRQINKALTLDNRVETRHFILRSAQSRAVKVRSNAKWKVRTIPENAGVITSSWLTGTYGVETEPPVSYHDENVGYIVNPDLEKIRDHYLVFEDTYVPKRFEDVMIKITQCTNNKDLPLEKYRDLWEAMYGLDPARLEPDDNGDVSKNKNKVQWHYDQDGNIFFSAMFGSQRMMTTNLSAITYDTNIANPPTVYQEFTGFSTVINRARWGYGGWGPATQDSDYKKRPRIGMAYNWRMATARMGIGLPLDEKSLVVDHAQHQGICPNGWHIPSHKEWMLFIKIVTGSPALFSENKDGSKSVLTLKDVCEKSRPNSVAYDPQQGLSFDLLNGGFGALYTIHPGADKTDDAVQAQFQSSSTGVPYKDKSTGSTIYLYMLADVVKWADSNIESNLYVRCLKN